MLVFWGEMEKGIMLGVRLREAYLRSWYLGEWLDRTGLGGLSSACFVPQSEQEVGVVDTYVFRIGRRWAEVVHHNDN